MPYIMKEQRSQFDVHIYNVVDSIGDSLKNAEKEFDPAIKGIFNYTVTKIIVELIKDSGKLSYSKINDMIGALECCKLELYRRLAAPYEDKKAIDNGDVYSGFNI